MSLFDDLEGLGRMAKKFVEDSDEEEQKATPESARLLFECPCGVSRAFDLRAEMPSDVVAYVQAHVGRCDKARGS